MTHTAGSVLFAIILCMVATSCVPTAVKQFDHIRAVGWDSSGEPMALAERTIVMKVAWALNPDGPGMYDEFGVRGLVLITGNQRNQLPVNIPGAHELNVDQVVSRHDGDGFLVIVSVAGWDDADDFKTEYRCLIAHQDGSVSPCNIPDEYEIMTLYALPPGGRVAYVVRKDDESRKERLAVDVDTGEIGPIDSPDPPSLHKPSCPSRYEQLSPNRAILAYVCQGYGRTLTMGLWTVDRMGNARFHYEVSGMTTMLQHTQPYSGLEEMVTESYVRHSLVWSGNQDRLYWCGGPFATGVVMTAGEEKPVTHTPCLIQAVWAEEGYRLVGVIDHKLAECRLGFDDSGDKTLICVSGKKLGKRISN